MEERSRSAGEIIEELRAELQRAELDDPAERARLQRLLEKLDARLEEGVEEEASRNELVSELRDEVVEFAVEHPDLASTIRGFMRMLSSIGI